jgi:hypothetical protein
MEEGGRGGGGGRKREEIRECPTSPSLIEV